jgi:hypothetical protein
LQGQWVDGFKQGTGSFTYAGAARTYSGSFHHDSFHGPGKLTVREAGKDLHYEGAFQNGVFHGQGTLTDTRTLQVFVGTFADDQPHGAGKLLNVFKPAAAFKRLHASVVDNAESAVIGVWQNGTCISGMATNVCIDFEGRWGQALRDAIESKQSTTMSAKEDYLHMITTLSVTSLFPEAVLPASKEASSRKLLALYTGALTKNGPEDAAASCVYEDGSEFVGTSVRQMIQV